MRTRPAASSLTASSPPTSLPTTRSATPQDYKPLIVGYHNGAAVRLSDVADVTDSVQNIRSAGYLNGKPAIPIIIFRQPGANIIQTVENIRSELPSIKASIPSDIETTIVLDRTLTIRASVKDVERTLIISICLVVGVVFVFLRNPRATLIPSVAVPVSLIGTFAVMYLLGYSLDNLSLMALTISTGFVVDDAIVVMENIYAPHRKRHGAVRCRSQGRKGNRLYGLLHQHVPDRRFYSHFADGRHCRDAFSANSPLLFPRPSSSRWSSRSPPRRPCARICSSRKRKSPDACIRLSDRFFAGMLSFYRRTLLWVLDNSVLTLTVLLLVIALNVVVVVVIPKGFFPQQDTGVIFGGLQGPQDASFAVMDDSVQRLAAVIKSDPAVDNVVAFTGGQGTTNGGFIFMALKPLEERKASATQILGRLRPKMPALPVASAFLQPAQDLRIGGRASNALYQYTIQSDNVQDLAHWGPILLSEMRKLARLSGRQLRPAERRP